MQTQGRIWASITASLVVSGVLGFFAFSVVRGIDDDLARGRYYTEIINKTFALNLLVATFDQESSQRGLYQLGEVRASLTKLLDGLYSTDVREESLVGHIRKNNQELGPLLDQFLTLRATQDGGLRAELGNMLASQLWTKVRFISDDTARLKEISESRVISAHTKAGITVLFLLLTLIIANVIISLVSGRGIVSMQEGLRKQREWLRVTLTSIGDAVIATDLESRIAFLNPVAATLTGWPVEEALGRPVQDLFKIVNEKTREPAEDIVGRVLLEGVNVTLANHTVLVARDGREIPIEDSAAPIRDRGGRVAGVVLVFHDVTDKRRAQESLRQSREDLDRAQEVGHIGWWRLDTQRNVLTWSDENHRIFGVPEGTPLSYEAFLETVHPDDRRHVDAQWMAALRGEPYDIEHRIVADGRVKWVREKAYLEFDAGDNLLGGFGITQDVTERKLYEEALRESEARFRLLFETMTEGFAIHEIITDEQGRPCDYRYIDVNPSFEKLTGLKRAQLLGRSVLELLPGTEAYWIERFGRVAMTGEPAHFEDYSAALGRWYEVMAYRSAPLQFAVIFSDITDRKQAEAERERLLAERTAIMENMTDGLTIADPEGRVIYHNPASLALHGYSCLEDGLLSKDEMLDQWRILDLTGQPVPMEDWPLPRALGGRTFNGYELRVQRLDGKKQFIGSYSGTLVHNASGRPPFAVVTVRDVTEQKRAEELLHRYRLLAGHSRDIILFIRRDDGRILEANLAAETAYGYSREELLRLSIHDLRTPEARGLSDEQMAQADAPGILFETVHRCRDGRTFPVEVSSRGETIGGTRTLISIVRDITERKRAEDILIESESRFRLLSRTAARLLEVDDPLGVVNELAAEVMDHLDCQAFFNFVVDEQLGKLHLNACSGIPEEEARRIEWLDYGIAVCGCVARDGVRIVAEDICSVADPRTELVQSYGIRAYCCHPLMAAGRVIGTLSFGTSTRSRFSPQDLDLMKTVADQVAVAMERMRLIREVQRSRDELEVRVRIRTAELEEVNSELRVIESALRHSETKLRRNNELLQKVFDGITDPLLMLDGCGLLTMVNRAAMSYYGVGEDTEVLGKACFQGLRGKETACPECLYPFLSAGVRTMSLERTGIIDPGRMENVTIYPVLDEQGERDAVIIRISDITQAKILERQILQNEKLASLGLVTSGIAHEINNPNSFIYFNLPILRSYLEGLLPIVDEHAALHPEFEVLNIPYADLREDLFRLLENMEQGSQRISKTIGVLKSFVRKRDLVGMQPVDLKQLADKVVALCHTELRHKISSFEILVTENLPPMVSDPEALEQVLLNLLINAIHACDKPDSYVSLSGRYDRKAGFIIEITDNGSGIEEAAREKIFDPFFTTKSSSEGTGLGLYICHNHVTSLGGRIEVESKVGEGTTFRVVLPQLCHGCQEDVGARCSP
ncbi:MAG: PAS domain S-box protein [Syntrophobacteraceae bacterium]|nr:PAS domain S-box protein [Syntrophobacteraceae bacterium]